MDAWYWSERDSLRKMRGAIRRAKACHVWIVGAEDGVYVQIPKSKGIEVLELLYSSGYGVHMRDGEVWLDRIDCGPAS